MAVLEFDDRSGYPDVHLGEGAARVLRSCLRERGWVEVIDGHAARVEGRIVTEASEAVRVGASLKAGFVVYGAVTGFALRSEVRNVLGTRQKQTWAECTVEVRMVDVTSWHVVATQSARGVVEAGSLPPRREYEDAVEGRFLRAAMEKLVPGLTAALR